MIRRRTKDHHQSLDVGQIDQSIVASPNSKQVINNYNFQDPYALAVKHLRRAVLKRCESERIVLRLASPTPMPVQWTLTERDVSDPLSAIFTPDTPTKFDVRSNKPKEFAKQFLSLDRHRLVIIGDGGAGKSVLAELLQWQLLNETSDLRFVPILLSLSSWNIDRHKTLNDWLTVRLKLDFPDVWDKHDPTLAEQLVQDNLILPILDGLDEVQDVVRMRVWDTLNGNLTGRDALVLTCRTAEYEAVTEKRALVAAAVIEAHPLKGPEIAEYLNPSVHRLAEWNAVQAAFERDDSSRLVEVCSNPFGLWLFRSVYVDGDRDPTPLLNSADYPDTDTIKAHLFYHLIPTVMTARPTVGKDDLDARRPRRAWDSDDAQRWLSFLARRLRGTTDIRWWQLSLTPDRPQDLERRTKGAFSVGNARESFLTRIKIRLRTERIKAGTFLFMLMAWSVFIILSRLLSARPAVEPTSQSVGGLIGLGLFIVLVFIVVIGLPFVAVLNIFLGHEPGQFDYKRGDLTPFLRAAKRKRKREHVDAIAAILAIAFGALYGYYDPLGFVRLGVVPHNTLIRLVLLVAVGLALSQVCVLGYTFFTAVYNWIALEHDDKVSRDKCPACLVEHRKETRWRAPLATYLDSRRRAGRFFMVTSVILGLAGGLAITIWLVVDALRMPRGIDTGRAAIAIPIIITAVVLLMTPVGLVVAMWHEPAWFGYILASKWLAFHGKLPWRTMTFLEDAHRLGLLRESGAAYQFRHAELQDYLSGAAMGQTHEAFTQLVAHIDADQLSEAVPGVLPELVDSRLGIREQHRQTVLLYEHGDVSRESAVLFWDTMTRNKSLGAYGDASIMIDAMFHRCRARYSFAEYVAWVKQLEEDKSRSGSLTEDDRYLLRMTYGHALDHIGRSRAAEDNYRQMLTDFNLSPDRALEVTCRAAQCAGRRSDFSAAFGLMPSVIERHQKLNEAFYTAGAPWLNPKRRAGDPFYLFSGIHGSFDALLAKAWLWRRQKREARAVARRDYLYVANSSYHIGDWRDAFDVFIEAVAVNESLTIETGKPDEQFVTDSDYLRLAELEGKLDEPHSTNRLRLVRLIARGIESGFNEASYVAAEEILGRAKKYEDGRTALQAASIMLHIRHASGLPVDRKVADFARTAEYVRNTDTPPPGRGSPRQPNTPDAALDRILLM